MWRSFRRFAFPFGILAGWIEHLTDKGNLHLACLPNTSPLRLPPALELSTPHHPRHRRLTKRPDDRLDHRMLELGLESWA